MAAAVDGIKRWICPTDRELSLRAKLNAGWSIHSQDYFHKPEPILECELRAIENVILRAKEIDITDKDRIRKMICKLENMRRNSVGDGKTTCSMCGVTFGWLRSSSIQCSDCSMAVCEKCRIDIHSAFEESILCKICSEQRELWKKSGGWFYGALPHVENLNCEDLKCYQQGGSETWEHRARDIVRLESFEAPEQTGSKMFYKTWAINSSPDLIAMEDEIILRKFKKNKFRKCSEGAQLANHLMPAPPGLNASKISASCPSLQVAQEEEIRSLKRCKKMSTKFKFLKPTRKMIEKIVKRRKLK